LDYDVSVYNCNNIFINLIRKPMKKLEIKNFDTAVMDIYSDFLEIKYSTDMGDKYVMGIDIRDVISFKPIGPKHYKMSIDKMDREEGRGYHIWLWDMEANISYPMSVNIDSLKSISEFTKFLNHTLKLASEGVFDGSPGNKIK
jgi:hypothetical protein